MKKIITFINEKGGVGKTSVCLSTAWELAKTNKVLIIDLDGQGSNITFYLGVEKNDDTLTMLDILRKSVPIRSAVVHIKDGLDVIPGNISCQDISNTIKVKKMKEVIRDISSDYDYIFFDVSPSPDYRHLLALSASTHSIIVSHPDIASFKSCYDVMDSLDEVMEGFNPDHKVLGILFNENENVSNLGKSVRESAERFAAGYNSKIFKTRIRRSVSMGELVQEHIGITDYKPSSPVAQDIRNFIKEIEEE